MTTGEAIDEILETKNTGTSQVTDSAARNRARRALQKAGDKGWTLRPVQRRFASGTVALVLADNGIGLAPTDFGSSGPKLHVYVQGASHEVDYVDPAELMDLLQTNPNASASRPDCYTIRGEEGGRQQIHIYPRNSGSLTLVLENYQIKAPKLVDRPSRPVTAEDAAGNPNGAYTYRVTFVTADGETEGGEVSVSRTVVSKKIQLTSIPVSPVSTVTSRKIYRTAAGGEQHKLLATLSDNVTTTYLDNIADGSLGANVPTTATGISGLERFPEDHHRIALVEVTIRALDRGEGDGRAPVTFPPESIAALMAMWTDDKAQHTRRRTPAYGEHAFNRR